MKLPHLTVVLLTATGLAVAGCSGGEPEDPATAEVGEASSEAIDDRPLPGILDEAEGMQSIAEALKATGIATAFDGNGSYTLLAPTDAAFEAGGDKGKALVTAEDHAPLAALVKSHMLPGFVSVKDIEAAIAASDDGKATMTTVNGDDLVFSKDSDAVLVSGTDGSSAKIAGKAIGGGASNAIPLDGLLKQF